MARKTLRQRAAIIRLGAQPVVVRRGQQDLFRFGDVRRAFEKKEREEREEEEKWS